MSNLRRAEEAQFPLPEEFRETLVTAAGNRFFDDLHPLTQASISVVFAERDEEGLRELIETFDRPTVERLALAMDDAVDAVIAEESSYHSWMTSVEIE